MHGQAEQQNHQDNGQQTADAARTAAAVEMNNQHAAETLLNLVERDTPNPMQEQRIELPNTPDPLAAAALPNPLQGKSASGDVKGNSEGKGEVDGLKLGQQVQAQGEKQTTPRLRGGQAKHGGDIMPQGLPRPQVNQIAMGNAFGRQLAETLPQPQNPNTAPTPALTPAQTSAQTSAPAANAANVATTASTEGGAAIRELQLSITPDTGRAAADMPTLAVRPESKPAPTAPATATTPTPAATTTPAAIQTQTPPQTSSSPQSVVSQAMEGESAAKLVPLGEDSGKDGGKDGVKDGVKANGNNAASTTTSTSTANATAAAASKASAITQQTATADIRSPGIQVAMQLSKAVQNGMDRMTIRLDPAELGRVEVKLEVGHDGRVIALVAAERPETLEALRQDARSLERALQDAGLETDADSLNFSLDQGGQQGGALADDFGEGGNGRGIGDGDAGDDGEEPAAGDEILPRVVSNRALDISV